MTYFEDDNEDECSWGTVDAKLNLILNSLVALIQEIEKMAIDLTGLQAAVANESNVVSAAVVALKNVAAEISAAVANAVALDANTQASLNSLVAQINTDVGSLANAVPVANTPANTVANT